MRKKLMKDFKLQENKLFFQYDNDLFGRLYFVNDHLLRLTISKEETVSDEPTIMEEFEIPSEQDDTVATGGAGQKLHAPIVLEEMFKKVVPQKEGTNLKSSAYEVVMDDELSKIVIKDQKGKIVFHQEGQPGKTKEKEFLSLRIISQPEEYFFGGGTQNGIVNLKGRKIEIENQNMWTEGGVASPVPFFFSTKGYGVLVNTFTKGSYSFHTPRATYLEHEDQKLDLFIILGEKPEEIIHGYHELTGLPHLSPLYSYYPAHLNAYNRDFWAEVTPESDGAVPFPNGKYYKEYQPISEKTFNTGYRVGTIEYQGQKLVPNVSITKEVTFVDADEKGNPQTMIHESLNGEKENYPFSARGIIDRYKKYDLPLGWFLPNDGYGAGYGQTETLAGDLENLAKFGHYARENGVELGLWTQENLAPKDPENPVKFDRDLEKEVALAGVTALKTDVAWVGEGYTFGLNGVADAFEKMTQLSKNRPFTVSLDGWAGTQRYAAVWSGDQEGSDWQNLKFHIPTYLSTGLSGNPNVGGDMDGIFGGDNPVIQTRDIQWKSFTPLQLSMDGWGSKSKDLGIQFGEEYLDINRFYLKLKSTFLPYFYSLAKIAQETGAPILRPTFFVEANEFTYGSSLDYQFLVGDNLLVAPIYEPYQMKENGDGKRASLYLPDAQTTWYDFFTGEAYQGGKTLSDFEAPLWKLPLFVKEGSILPLINASNNPNEIDRQQETYLIYPGEKSSFTLYEDDGMSQKYLTGAFLTAEISQEKVGNKLQITFEKAEGSYDEVVEKRTRQVDIFAPEKPSTVTVNGEVFNDWSYGEKVLRNYAPQESSSSFKEMKISQGNFMTIDLPEMSIYEKTTIEVTF